MSDNKWLDYILYGGKVPTLDLPEVPYPIGFEPNRNIPEPEDDARESALRDRESGNW